MTNRRLLLGRDYRFWRTYRLAELRGDVLGGLTCAIVGLPIALAFGFTAGLDAEAGLYGAIAVGLMAALFGATRGQVTGPSGPMAIAFAIVVAHHAENLVEAFTIVALAGAIQVALGLLRVGRFVVYTPYSVISGYTTGIGLLIMVLQIPPLLGGAKEQSATHPVQVVSHLLDSLSTLDAGALGVGCITLVVVFMWPTKLSRLLPGSMTGLVVGTLAAVLWFPDVPRIGDIAPGLPPVEGFAFSLDLFTQGLHPALTLAMLGAVDSLLSAVYLDTLTRSRHNANVELVAQGLGNITAGLFGGIPGAGNTVIGVANLRAGGSTRIAGLISAALLATTLLGLGFAVEVVPLAALAAILIKVGWDIIDWRFMARLHQIKPEALFVMGTTLVLTVFVDLITAVTLGLIIAGMTAARQFERLQIDQVISVPLLDSKLLQETHAPPKQVSQPRSADEADDEASTETSAEASAEADDEASAEASADETKIGKISPDDIDPYSARAGLVTLRYSFSVASASKLTSIIGADIAQHDLVIVDFTEAIYLDDSAAVVIEHLVDIAHENGITFIAAGLSGQPARMIASLDALGQVPIEYVIPTLAEAKQTARNLLFD